MNGPPASATSYPSASRLDAASSRASRRGVGTSSTATPNATSTYMTLPSGATAWPATGSDRPTTSSALGHGRQRGQHVLDAGAGEERLALGRPDDDACAGRCRRPAAADVLLSEPTSAAWSPSRSATSSCARCGLGARDRERVREVQPGRDRAEPGGGQDQQPGDQHDPTVAEASPAQTVQHACHVHSLVDRCRIPDKCWLYVGGMMGCVTIQDEGARVDPRVLRTRRLLQDALLALAQGTQSRRDHRRRRRRPRDREPQHVLPALPRHRHAAGGRARRAGRARRRRPHPDPSRRGRRRRPRRAGPVRHPRRRERRPVPQRAGRARLPRRRDPPAPAHRGARARGPRAARLAARARRPAAADRRGRAGRVRHRGARRVARARPAAAGARRRVVGVVGGQRLARRGRALPTRRPDACPATMRRPCRASAHAARPGHRSAGRCGRRVS